MRASVFIATSLDGYIARENGDVDWLNSDESGSSDSDYGYKAFMDSVDVLVMGRNTFDQVLTFGDWPYGDKRVVVLTTRPIDPPARTVEARSATPKELFASLAHEGVNHIYVDGGVTIRSFLEAKLIQELIVTRIPVLLGCGIPLFGPLGQDIWLRHMETTSYPSGLVQSRYELDG